MLRRLAVMAAALAFSTTAFPAGGQGSRVEIAGLLGDKAVLIIDGTQKVLRTGEVTTEGIRLVGIEEEGVTLEIGGERDYYPLGSTRVGTSFNPRGKNVERVFRDRSGMFRTTGSINGYPVNFLIDTGASIVAMNSGEARRLGIQYLLDGEPTLVSTAAGNVTAYNIRLDNVAVGKIKLTGIEAVVIEGTHPEDVLLGMSFLGRLNVKNENEVMMLETKF